MKVIINIFFLLIFFGNVFAQEEFEYFDLSNNEENLRSELKQYYIFKENVSQLSRQLEQNELKESWILSTHRYFGYMTLLGVAVNGVFGYKMWDKHNNQSVPSESEKDRHKKLGYTVAGLSVATSTLGFINFWKMKDKKIGRKKRIIHLTLSSLATIGYITAAYKARYSRRSLEEGTANKPFLDLYSSHKSTAYIAIGSTLLTVGWIIW